MRVMGSTVQTAMGIGGIALCMLGLVRPAHAQLLPGGGLLSLPNTLRQEIQPPGTGLLQLPETYREKLQPDGTGVVQVPGHIATMFGNAVDAFQGNTPQGMRQQGTLQTAPGWSTAPNPHARLLPDYSVAPSNSADLLTQPSDWNGQQLQTSEGQSYTSGTTLPPNTTLTAAACWSVGSAAPFPNPPNNFSGQLTLPDGETWTPGSFLSPSSPVYAWMCANWKWSLDQTP